MTSFPLYFNNTRVSFIYRNARAIYQTPLPATHARRLKDAHFSTVPANYLFKIYYYLSIKMTIFNAMASLMPTAGVSHINSRDIEDD